MILKSKGIRFLYGSLSSWFDMPLYSSLPWICVPFCFYVILILLWFSLLRKGISALDFDNKVNPGLWTQYINISLGLPDSSFLCSTCAFVIPLCCMERRDKLCFRIGKSFLREHAQYHQIYCFNHLMLDSLCKKVTFSLDHSVDQIIFLLSKP